mgnify:CR=1 FL=1
MALTTGAQRAVDRISTSMANSYGAAEFLAQPAGPRVAVLELGGWDSHANQAAANGATTQALRTLDAGLAALREGLTASGIWRDSVVVVASEFGREVAINGTQGSDHGTGGAAFVLGGAICGGGPAAWFGRCFWRRWHRCSAGGMRSDDLQEKTMSTRMATTGMVLAILAGTSLAQAPGAAAPAFTINDTAGKPVALAAFKGKYVVLEWTNPECPFVQKHYVSKNM